MEALVDGMSRIAGMVKLQYLDLAINMFQEEIEPVVELCLYAVHVHPLEDLTHLWHHRGQRA
jgi:hypothetical protein